MRGVLPGGARRSWSRRRGAAPGPTAAAGAFAEAELRMGRGNSGKLVTEVKKGALRGRGEGGARHNRRLAGPGLPGDGPR